MHTKKLMLVTLNLMGGISVLGSYAYGLRTHPNAAQILWGGVPGWLQPFYTAGMLLAAAGYFCFTYFILFRLGADRTRVAGRFRYGFFNALYAAILFPSALWMPFTLLAVEQDSQALVWVVRLVLGVVGSVSGVLVWALLKVTPPQPAWAYRLALVGSASFCFQTAILDAIVWGVLFRL